MNDKKLHQVVEKIRSAKLCVPQSSGAIFVLADDSRLEISKYELIMVLCMLLGVEMHD